MNRLLIIDDDPVSRALVIGSFTPRGLVVQSAASAASGLDLILRERPDVVLLDVHLPDATGHEVFQQLRAIDTTVPVIFITASGDSDLAIEATKLGCYDYLFKPLNLAALEEQVTRALQVRRLTSVRVEVGVAEPAGERADALVGRCPAMQDVYKAIGRAAPHDITVLLRGESGTGKELVARAVYQHSRRAAQPFLAINCSVCRQTISATTNETRRAGSVMTPVLFTGVITDPARRSGVGDELPQLLDQGGQRGSHGMVMRLGAGQVGLAAAVLQGGGGRVQDAGVERTGFPLEPVGDERQGVSVRRVMSRVQPVERLGGFLEEHLGQPLQQVLPPPQPL